MDIYDTLILGSGYFSAGYAIARGHCAILEEHQICDTGFYLPLRSFAHHPYEPVTEPGRHLAAILDELAVFRDGMQNTNALECAFCRFLIEREITPILKCRVIGIRKQADGILDATVQTNEGLSHLYARRVLRTCPVGKKQRMTLLFLTDDPDGIQKKLLAAFPGATLEPAYYPGRYALHLPTEGDDENSIKARVYHQWLANGIPAKILYMAPVFYPDGAVEEPSDAGFDNPVKALEAGYHYGREERL